jgi:hypothetical protein
LQWPQSDLGEGASRVRSPARRRFCLGHALADAVAFGFEPKYNGFRVSNFATATTSIYNRKKQKSLNIFFPEVVAASPRERKIEAT